MAEPSFELHLQRLYAQPPALADASAFALRVQRRLDRGWAWRGVLIGVAGVAGGVIAAAQFIASNLVGRASAASRGASLQVHHVLTDLVQQAQALTPLHTLPLGGEAIWLAAGLAAVGVALLAARVFETF